MTKNLLILLSVIILSSCVSKASGPFFKLESVPDDMANVYFYRSAQDQFQTFYALLSVDGQTFARLNPNGYSLISLPPQDYLFSLNWLNEYQQNVPGYKVVQSFLQLEKGKSYFIQISSEYKTQSQLAVWRFGELPQQEAITHISSRRKQDLLIPVKRQ